MGLSLRPYQRTGAEHLRSVFGFAEGVPRTAFLFDEMGLGKTPQAVMSIPGPMYDEPEVATLVTAPAGLASVWARHVKDWRPDLKAKVIGRTRYLRAPHFGEVVIVSPDALGWASARPKSAAGIQAAAALRRLQDGMRAAEWRAVFILDEAHTIKGNKARRAIAVGELVRPCVAKGATAWALTATPMPRSPEDAFCLACRIGAESNPHAWGGRGIAGWAEWANATRTKSGTWKIGKPPSLPIDHPSILGRLALRRLVKDELSEIPAPTHAIRLVQLSGELSAEVDEIMRQACRSIGVSERTIDRLDLSAGDDADEALIKTITKTVGRGELSAISAKIAAAKTPHVIEDLLARVGDGEPVVVYSEHVATIERMKSLGLPVVMGGMSETAKAKAVAKFQDGDAPALGFTGAGRQGITLTRASTFIEADTNWSSDDRAQAIGRVVRFGREGTVTAIHYLADHPLERLKMRVLRRKRTFTLAALGSSL